MDQVAGKDGGVVTVNRTVAPNFWIGPNPDDLVLLGAKFDPCFRKDVRVQDEIINPQNDLATKMGCCMDQGESGGNCFSATEEGGLPFLADGLAHSRGSRVAAGTHR